MSDTPDLLETADDGCKAGGYYGAGFKGDRGVMQGDPLYPTIFTVVVGAVVQHWVVVMVEGA